MPDIFDRLANRPREETEEEDIFVKLAQPKKKPLHPALRVAGQAPVEFISEAVGQVPALAQIAAQTTPTIEATEELSRIPGRLSPGEELGGEKGLRNLLTLLGNIPGAEKLTPEGLRGTFEELTKGRFTPQTPLERILERPARVAGGIAGLGGGLKAMLSMIVPSLVGQSLREAGEPEALASAIEVGLPLAGAARRGLTLKPSEEKIAQFAKKGGLTEKELTPLLKSKRTQQKLGKLALKTEGLQKQVKDVYGKLSEDFYTPLKEKASKLGPLNESQISKVVEDLKVAQTELSRSKLPTPDKTFAKEELGKMIDNIQREGLGAEEIIDTWQDINKTVQWKRAGQKPFAKVKEVLKETLGEISPELAEEFELTNNLYARQVPFAKALTPTMIDDVLSLGKEGNLALGLILGNRNLLNKALGLVGGKFVAKELLTNPRYHNFARKLSMQAIKQDKAALRATLEQFRKVYDHELKKEKRKK